MKNLQKTNKEFKFSVTNHDKLGTLKKKAVELFSSETLPIEAKRDLLGEQFQSLNLELQDKNHTLQSKVAELDVITDYLKNILDNIAQGILFVDVNGMITTCNPAAQSILGIKSHQMIFRRFWEVFKDDALGFSMQKALKEKKETTTYHLTYQLPTHQSSELEVMTRFTLKNLQNASSQPQGMIIMIRDVTKMHHLQIMASRADRLKVLGEMAAQVAHEIRNPLGGIKGFASLLKRDLANNPELQKMASYIVEGTDSLNKLVNQILCYARPIHPHVEKTNLIALLRQVKQHILADTNISPDSINICINSLYEELILSLDGDLFKSAILNLVVNGIQAMPDGGTITLEVQKKFNYIVLSVTDTGMGISQETIPKLYSPFFTTKPDGNGLGLVEVQKVIQAHNGTIDVASVLNKGTTFVIKLPYV